MSIPEQSAASDEQLMSSLKTGEDAALAALMERWELPLKGFLLRFGLEAPAVEDLAQESFVRLYEKRGDFRDGAAFKPWLLTIAGNLARNALRSRRRHPTESLDAPAGGAAAAPEMADESPDARDRADRRELQAEVRAAVDGLPAPLREAVLCVEIEDMSHAEAAAVLDCSPKAVETRLYRARQLLRQSLSGLLGRPT